MASLLHTLIARATCCHADAVGNVMIFFLLPTDTRTQEDQAIGRAK
jgi:hypothetical protein